MGCTFRFFCGGMCGCRGWREFGNGRTPALCGLRPRYRHCGDLVSQSRTIGVEFGSPYNDQRHPLVSRDNRSCTAQARRTAFRESLAHPVSESAAPIFAEGRSRPPPAVAKAPSPQHTEYPVDKLFVRRPEDGESTVQSAINDLNVFHSASTLRVREALDAQVEFQVGQPYPRHQLSEKTLVISMIRAPSAQI
jgi:hypothetical protein